MKQTILIYGLVMAVAILLLKMIEFQFYFQKLSAEVYIGIIGVLFTLVGIWAGQRIARKRKMQQGIQQGEFKLDEEALLRTGISKREIEVLEWMARGLSNQEIADTLFVSLNTVKTHTASLFLKLDAKRRTQAIQRAKDLRLIP